VHARPLPDHEFPRLDEYLRGTVESRIRRRLRLHLTGVPRRCVNLALNTVRAPTRSTPVLLHADLYRENVPFDHQGQPVFLDPLPRVGDPAFDWAFFVVYFALADDPADRLHAAAEVSGVAVRALLPWCLTLCLDGLLYYHEVGDAREARMVKVMTTLAGEGGMA
jgi:streptomycin 6-kinase